MTKLWYTHEAPPQRRVLGRWFAVQAAVQWYRLCTVPTFELLYSCTVCRMYTCILVQQCRLWYTPLFSGTVVNGMVRTVMQQRYCSDAAGSRISCWIHGIAIYYTLHDSLWVN